MQKGNTRVDNQNQVPAFGCDLDSWLRKHNTQGQIREGGTDWILHRGVRYLAGAAFLEHGR